MTKSTAKRGNSYSHLSLEEREEIVIGLELGHSLGVIAKSIKRSVSTISRECTRNQPSCNKVKYRAVPAHKRSQERQEKAHRRARLNPSLSKRSKSEVKHKVMHHYILKAAALKEKGRPSRLKTE